MNSNQVAPLSLTWRLSEPDEQRVGELLAQAKTENVVARVHDRDDTLWGPAGQAETADRLGWLDAPADATAMQAELESLADEIVAEGYTDVVLCGMGGSSLAPEVIWQWLGKEHHKLRLRLLDTTDPDAIFSVDAATTPERTLILVSTKSGGTIETISLFKHFWQRHPEGKAFVAVTDPGSGLEEIAKVHNFRKVIHGNPQIGGRYSALSPFGTVPAALVGADLDGLTSGGRAAFESSRKPVEENPAARLGVALAALAKAGRNKLLVHAEDPSLSWFGLWLEQLVAESTGKHGKGILPVVAAAGTAHAAPGVDRVVLALRSASNQSADLEAQLTSTAAEGVPVLELHADGPTALGAAFFSTEFAVAVSGWGLGINPFDQPDVQAAKDATRRVLSEREGPTIAAADLATAEALREFVAGLAAPQYLAILAYLPPSEQASAALEELRAALVGSSDAASTASFGPRYLHSTGQLHKGGEANGRFLVIEHEQRAALPVPDADFDFSTLIHAQSLGDFETLVERGRNALRVNLGSDWKASLEQLSEQLTKESLCRSRLSD